MKHQFTNHAVDGKKGKKKKDKKSKKDKKDKRQHRDSKSSKKSKEQKESKKQAKEVSKRFKALMFAGAERREKKNGGGEENEGDDRQPINHSAAARLKDLTQALGLNISEELECFSPDDLEMLREQILLLVLEDGGDEEEDQCHAGFDGFFQ